MVAAADGDTADTVLPRAHRRQVERADDEPRARQPLPIPGHGRGEIRHDDRDAGFSHAAFVDVREVSGQQREPVGGVPKKIALDQNLANGPRFLRLQPGAFTKCRGERNEIGGGKMSRHSARQ
jgi:hypothetical protein